MNWYQNLVSSLPALFVSPARARTAAGSPAAGSPAAGSPAAGSPSADAPGAEAWMVFGMRLLLAVSALLTLYIGMGGAVAQGYWAWLVFVAYVVHSLVLLVMARVRAGFWHGPVVYWVDIGWYGLMIHASAGLPTPFFSFFFFAILAASFRHGFDTGARLTLGAALVVTLSVLAAPSAQATHLLLLRATFVLALGYMIAFWGGLAVDQRRRLALLRDVSRLSNPRFGVQHTLDSLMEKLLRFYGGDSCVLLMQDGAGEWMLHTVHHPKSGRAPSRSRTVQAAVQPLLALGGTVSYRGNGILPGRRQRAAQLAAGAAGWRRIDAGACAAIADLLDSGCFISAALPLRKGAGRIFITAGQRLQRADASFLNHIVQQAFPVIETIDLLDRLASDAAFRERQTIARDLHDSTIQPYIGLRHAVAAIRTRAGDDHAVAAELDRLLDMCSDTIGDMRQFAQRFRNGRQQEPELLIALRRQLNQVRAFYDVDVALDAAAAPAISDRMAAEVFQVVTEGVNNVCKHTRARTAQVVLAREDGLLAIDIVNPRDALGPALPKTAASAANPATPAAASFEPRSIAERVQALGGTLAVDNGASHTRLRIRLPI